MAWAAIGGSKFPEPGTGASFVVVVQTQWAEGSF